jgi:hypothetical protein
MRHYVSSLVVIFLLVSFPDARKSTAFDHGKVSLPSASPSILGQNTGIWHGLPDGPGWSDAGGWDQPKYYSTIQTADINGDGRAEVIARSAGGIEVWKFDPSSNAWSRLPDGPGWSDAGGWDQTKFYSTIQTADINGDGRAEVIARSAEGIVVWNFDPSNNTWSRLPDGPNWSDAGGWDQPKYYSTIQTADINGDGRAEVIARSAEGIEAWKFVPSSNTWSKLSKGPGWSDADGWNLTQYYSTIQTANIDGDGQDELLARGSGGIAAEGFDYPVEGLSINHDSPAFVGQPTRFLAVISGGTDVHYHWAFGDSQSGDGIVDNHTYASTGTFSVLLTASNPVSKIYIGTRVTVKAILFLPQVMR